MSRVWKISFRKCILYDVDKIALFLYNLVIFKFKSF